MGNQGKKNPPAYRVFLGDGDGETETVFNESLGSIDAVTVAARRADLVLAAIREGGFDAIFLDSEMVLSDGGDSLAEICASRLPGVPVILIGEDEDRLVSAAEGFAYFDCLCKPISARRLSRTVKNAAETRLLRETRQRLVAENENYRRHLAEMARGRHNESRMSWERYRRLFTESKDAIFIVSAEGRLIDINRACMDILGYEGMELKRMHFWDFFSSPGEGISIFRLVCKQGDIRDFEADLRAADGSVRTCILAVNTLGLFKHSVREYQGIIRDITAQRRAEAALKKSEAKFRHLYYNSPVMMHSVGAEGKVVDVNNRWLEEMGYRREEVVGRDIGFFLYPPGREPSAGTSDFHKCWRRIEMDNQTIRLYRKDRSVIDILFNCLATTDPSGEEVSLFVGRNITKLRKAETELLRLKAAIEQSSDIILITDTDGGCLYANPALETITGHDRQSILGKIPRVLSKTAHDSDSYSKMWEQLRKGLMWEKNFVFQKKDDTLYEQQTTVFPVFDQSGKIINYVVIEKDVTEKRRLETIAEAANLMKNIGFIFSGIRHEIGNPINSLITTLTVLERKLETLPADTIRRFIKGSIQETSRVQYLLKSLKNFNLFENPHVRDIDLNQFMADFQSLIRKDFEDKGIEIHLRLSEKPLRVLIDPRAFHQVMLNLVTNAAEALPDRNEPQIAIRTGKEAAFGTVTIQDNGWGMSPKQLSSLFTPFFTTKSQGTGLGLVIVKKLLLKMNSTIDVESQKDMGTTVTIKIPEGNSHE